MVELLVVSESFTCAGVGLGVGLGIGVVVVDVGDSTAASELEVSSGVAGAVMYPPTGPSNVLAAV